MEDPLQRSLNFQNQVVPHRARLTRQMRQPDQEKDTPDGANKLSSLYITYLKPTEVKIQTETDQQKGNQTLSERQTSIEKTHAPSNNPTETDARMRFDTQIKKSMVAQSNGPHDAQAEKTATRLALESNARNLEERMPYIFPDENKRRRIEVIIISSDEEEDNGVSNDKSFVTSPAGSYGKFVAEKLLKIFKEMDLLKNGNFGTSMKNYKGKEVAVCVSSMCIPGKDRAHDKISNSCTKDGDMAGTKDQDFSEDADMVEDKPLCNYSDMEKGRSVDVIRSTDDDLEECWLDMDLAMEIAKENESREEATALVKRKNPCEEDDEEEVCVHDCKLDEQHGLVCRICGLIEKKIDTIFEYQWHKPSRSIKTYPVGSRGQTDANVSDRPAKLLNPPDGDIIGSDMAIHPSNLEHIRPHQLEGFNFLVKNLTGENPGGCILAHAPGSGKTFMLISFIQSFLDMYPSLRPLIVLPKGIIPTWRKEFENWQIKHIPLYDLYSDKKTDNRSQQLEILKKWEENKSVLLLGYQQFASIVTDDSSVTVRECRDKLLNIPGLLILDEGHTPRNENTNCLNSLARVQTVRKVVLSGTLFQNHVKEVFNIVNLIRPKFLMSEHARTTVRRIMSQVNMAGRRNTSSEALFCDLVEETLKQETNSSMKIEVIKGLRKLTASILHYYKGDLLDDLPGLCDFTVFLDLTPRQKQIVKTIRLSNNNFKRNSSCALVTVHPSLEKKTTENEIDISEGVKAKFIMNLISLAVSHKEKVLVFGMSKRSLEFLEELVTSTTKWAMNQEVFKITGETSPPERERATEMFNKSKDAKVLFGSVKACGEGISLVGASRLVILDQHANPSVTRQVVGRAFRPGQVKKVFCYRLVSRESPEEEEHATSLRKESVSKMWFECRENELNEYRFGLKAVNINNCEDEFFESAGLREDVNALYKR